MIVASVFVALRAWQIGARTSLVLAGVAFVTGLAAFAIPFDFQRRARAVLVPGAVLEARGRVNLRDEADVVLYLVSASEDPGVLASADAVVVCDYGLGSLAALDRDRVRETARMLIVDARRVGEWASLHADVATPNAAETAALLGAGSLAPDTGFLNVTRNVKEKGGRLFHAVGKKYTPIEKAVAGVVERRANDKLCSCPLASSSPAIAASSAPPSPGASSANRTRRSSSRRASSWICATRQR